MSFCVEMLFWGGHFSEQILLEKCLVYRCCRSHELRDQAQYKCEVLWLYHEQFQRRSHADRKSSSCEQGRAKNVLYWSFTSKISRVKITCLLITVGTYNVNFSSHIGFRLALTVFVFCLLPLEFSAGMILTLQ